MEPGETDSICVNTACQPETPSERVYNYYDNCMRCNDPVEENTDPTVDTSLLNTVCTECFSDYGEETEFKMTT